MRTAALRVTLTVVTFVSLGATRGLAIETTYGEDPVPTTHRMWRPFTAYGMDPVPQKSLAERWQEWRAKRTRMTMPWSRNERKPPEEVPTPQPAITPYYQPIDQQTSAPGDPEMDRIRREVELPTEPAADSWQGTTAGAGSQAARPRPMLFTDPAGVERPVSSRRRW
jgi:hypothetical protein